MIHINRKDLPEPNTTCQICGHKYYVCTKCIKLRTSGVETWRQYCDCIECYQLYVFLGKDVQDIDKEEYERALAIELPDGKRLTKEAKAKMDAVKKHFSPDAPLAHLASDTQMKKQNDIKETTSQKVHQSETIRQQNQNYQDYQGRNQGQGQSNQNKLNKKNGSNSKYLFNNGNNNDKRR